MLEGACYPPQSEFYYTTMLDVIYMIQKLMAKVLVWEALMSDESYILNSKVSLYYMLICLAINYMPTAVLLLTKPHQ